MSIRKPIPLLFCSLLFAIPALLGLAQQTWQSEAGSLAPLILCLGGWTLWHAVNSNKDIIRPGKMSLWAVVTIPSTLIYIFASTINMVALMAFSVWLVLAISFYALLGSQMVKKCLFPLLFLGLIVPLPYFLSVQLNALLRDWISQQSVAIAALTGLDVAQGGGTIIVGQYALAVENACAGASSTMSLVAIGLLFAYWVRNAGLGRAAGVALLAVPIALTANVFRVVLLLALVSQFGSRILDTLIHPLSGLLSFIVAAVLLATAAGLIALVFRSREEASFLPAAK